MPPKKGSELTTVALNRENHERLFDFKAVNRCRSFNEAVGMLLDGTEGSQSSLSHRAP